LYDAWASAGNPGWDFESVLPYFKRSETVQGRDRRFRGNEGPLRPAPVARPNPIALSFIDACVEAGHPRADDPNGASRDGVALHDLNIVDGVRQSAADAYLTAAVRGRPNLVIEDARPSAAAGVRSVRRRGRGADGVQRDIRASAEVILSAGAIDTPRLLMLSGIGPADELTELGIDVAVDLPAVGRNLQDHTVTGLVYEARRTIPPGTANHGEASLLWRSSPAEPACDVHLVMVDVAITSMAMPANCCTLLVANLRRASSGSTKLRSTDPGQPPLVAPNFLGEASELEKVLLGLATAREIAAAPAFRDWGLREVLPGPDTRDCEALTAFVRAATEPYNHASGTCRMGPGDDSVVDSTQGARAGGAARRGRINRADHPQRQHTRHGGHDRREGRRPHSRADGRSASAWLSGLRDLMPSHRAARSASPSRDEWTVAAADESPGTVGSSGRSRRHRPLIRAKIARRGPLGVFLRHLRRRATGSGTRRPRRRPQRATPPVHAARR
jgi:choline dehydrogenase-like flavoprotein